ncbi:MULTISPECIES: phage holin family protein [Photorhabdus]|uniref:Phage holin family protein n=1 Tax=Photorhabdus bodei TaxID=2029681 RepID=A0AAW6BIM9_9GAMM|nr:MULTISPECIES: phage holin family protein [Photorhabdus]MCC8465607.1 phage holin family protein [Photorhabdus bodei]MCT8353298.1 phage holin family protein [Photorhabdus kayaii]MDB6368269.1 phage holin family protein [Photorhabdus bodei]MDB6372968.1 phage holin family protein [Photorhabdus bodei]
MINSSKSQGPAKGVLDILQRIAAVVIEIVETRLQLIVLELEKEKATLIQLIVIASLTLLLTAFGLMCLLVMIFWAIDPSWRFIVLASTTSTLLILALIGLIWTIRKARNSTLLSATREQLKIDREMLEDHSNE